MAGLDAEIRTLEELESECNKNEQVTSDTHQQSPLDLAANEMAFTSIGRRTFYTSEDSSKWSS